MSIGTSVALPIVNACLGKNRKVRTPLYSLVKTSRVINPNYISANILHNNGKIYFLVSPNASGGAGMKIFLTRGLSRGTLAFAYTGAVQSFSVAFFKDSKGLGAGKYSLIPDMDEKKMAYLAIPEGTNRIDITFNDENRGYSAEMDLIDVTVVEYK